MYDYTTCIIYYSGLNLTVNSGGTSVHIHTYLCIRSYTYTLQTMYMYMPHIVELILQATLQETQLSTLTIIITNYQPMLCLTCDKHEHTLVLCSCCERCVIQEPVWYIQLHVGIWSLRLVIV